MTAAEIYAARVVADIVSIARERFDGGRADTRDPALVEAARALAFHICESDVRKEDAAGKAARMTHAALCNFQSAGEAHVRAADDTERDAAAMQAGGSLVVADENATALVRLLADAAGARASRRMQCPTEGNVVWPWGK